MGRQEVYTALVPALDATVKIYFENGVKVRTELITGMSRKDIEAYGREKIQPRLKIEVEA